MTNIVQTTLIHSVILSSIVSYSLVARSQESLSVVYPPQNHETTSEKIFFIGTASSEGKVLVNGQTIKRSPQGHFAPSFPLELGKNTFQLRHNNETLNIIVTRISDEPTIPKQLGFAENSLTPGANLTQLPGETICFSAVASPEAKVSVRLPGVLLPLLPETDSVTLPPNSGVLVGKNAPNSNTARGKYRGCTQFEQTGNLGKPSFEISFKGKTVTQQGTGEIIIAPVESLEVVEVITDEGIARTDASTDYSRLTPLPKGTRARVTGKEGEWLRLDYGGWIKAEETKPLPQNTPTDSLIRSITSQQLKEETEIIFPLQTPVPVVVQQESDRITLTLHNTTAQTDTIFLNDNPLIKRLDWQQIAPTKIAYTFQLKTEQQWGYNLHYRGTSLIFTLRHPPQLSSDQQLPLEGIKILLDPGHGGAETGSKSATGYTEKEINLLISQLLNTELTKLGATVYLTRKTDIDLALEKRVAIINQIKPDLALSIHYNALPDNGDAENTQGISTFWYHPQAHNLAVDLHKHLVTTLNRPSYGVFWNNLALTRPHVAPTILLELGFMINPWEFEWISDRDQQQQLVKAIAEGIVNWTQDRDNFSQKKLRQ
jgi:N-acetylmuramoyl-L-alanine amidase